MKKLIVLCLLVPLLGGCAAGSLQKFQNAWQVATSATVTPQSVQLAVDVFVGVEQTGTIYLHQKRCVLGHATATCRDPKVTPTIESAMRKGRRAVDAMIAFQQTHPGALGDKGLYDAAQAAITTLEDILPKNGAAP